MANIERIDNSKAVIRVDVPVRVKRTGNIVEIRMMSRNTPQTIQKIDKDSYIVIDTGEVRKFNHTERREENTDSIKQSMSKLRDLINANSTDSRKIKFITLTYRENMCDSKKLYNDIKKFHMRLKYYLKNQPFEYISAIEPQGRGAFHAHELLFFDKKAPFIPNEKLAEIWGHGFTKINNIDNVDNIGLYLTAYLCDIDLEQANINDINSANYVKTVEGANGGQNKRIIKGGRLKYYPTGIRIFRCSRGIKRPVVFKCSYPNALEEVQGYELAYEKTILVTKLECDYENIINYKTFKKGVEK